jgi:hypothetical protein
MKRWTLRSVLRTDIFQRGVPWTLLMKRSQIAETDLNVRSEQKVCVVAAGLVTLALLGAVWSPWLVAIPPAGLALIVALNADFYRFLARRRGWGFTVAAVPLHYVYFCCCGVSVLIALTLWHLALRHHETNAPAEADPRATTVRKDQAVETVAPRPRPSQARRPSRWIKP